MYTIVLAEIVFIASSNHNGPVVNTRGPRKFTEENVGCTKVGVMTPMSRFFLKKVELFRANRCYICAPVVIKVKSEFLAVVWLYPGCILGLSWL